MKLCWITCMAWHCMTLCWITWHDGVLAKWWWYDPDGRLLWTFELEQGAEFPRHCNPHCFLSAMFYHRLPCTMFISCFIIVLPCTIHAPFRSIHWTQLHNCSFKSIGELFCPAPYFALIAHCIYALYIVHILTCIPLNCIFLVVRCNQTAHNILSFIPPYSPSPYIWSYGEESHAPDTL